MSKGLHGLGCTRSKIAVPMGIVGPDAQRLLDRLVEILLVVRLLRSKEVVPSGYVHVFEQMLAFSCSMLIKLCV